MVKVSSKISAVNMTRVKMFYEVKHTSIGIYSNIFIALDTIMIHTIFRKISTNIWKQSRDLRSNLMDTKDFFAIKIDYRIQRALVLFCNLRGMLHCALGWIIQDIFVVYTDQRHTKL